MIVTTNTASLPTFLTDGQGNPISKTNPLAVQAVGDASGSFVAGAVFWKDSDTTLAASTAFTGIARDSGGMSGGVGSRFNFFIAEVFSDQAGVLYVDKSFDGVTWKQTGKLTMSMSGSDSITLRVSAPYYRARYANGMAAQTSFLLTSAFTTA